MSGVEVTLVLATPSALCPLEDHGHHLQIEKAVAVKTFSLRPMTKSVNVLEFDVPKSEEDISH